MPRSGFSSGALEAPYRKVRKLGQGGMAETYLAVRREPGEPGDPRTRKTTIEDRVCCKRLLAPHDKRFSADLEREIAILASLRHSNITQIRNWHIAERELYLELIDGCDLRQLVMALPNRRLTPPLTTLIGIELCKALAYAHTRTSKGKPAGIVHRDISPSNVMISYAGEVKLTDFGLAAVVALEQRDGEPLSGFVRGKLCYMAPEQAKGDKFADHRADLFSLGAVLYELLTGRRPALGSDDEVFAALISGNHPPIRELAPDVPEALEQIVERLLRPNPAQRFRSADNTLDELAALAPPHTLFRTLGALAKQAVPPETLTYTAFGEDMADGESGVAPLPAQHTPTPEVTATPAEQNAPPSSPAVKRRVLRRMIGGGAMLLSVSVVTLAVRSATNPAGGEKVAETAAVNSSPAALAGIVPVDTTQLSNALPATEEMGEVDHPSVPTPETVESPAREVASPKEALASLQIGVVPIAKVWVDGRYQGWSWSPIHVRLEPGVDHVVSAGERKAEVKQTVRLDPGERRSLTLHLPKAE